MSSSNDTEVSVNSRVNALRRARYHRDKTKYKERAKRYYLENAERITAKSVAYAKQKRAIARLHKAIHKLILAEQRAEARQLQLEERAAVARERARAWYAANSERAKAYNVDYRKINSARYKAYGRQYTARKLQAQPIWLTADQVAAIFAVYRQAEVLKEQGETVEVDHIVPLQGRTVCGLHVAWNLQILEASANSVKGNNWWPDMWERK